MSIVLDTCTFKDLNLLPENSPVYRAVAWHLEYNYCYVTTIVAAEIYREIRDSISLQRAENALAMIKNGRPVQIADDRGLVDLAIEARDLGLSWIAAFTAALAHAYDCPILTNDTDFDAAVEAGFCEVKHYP